MGIVLICGIYVLAGLAEPVLHLPPRAWSSSSRMEAPGLRIRGPRRRRRPGSDAWLWECVLIRDGEPVAHLQENIPAQPGSIGKASPAPLELDDDGGTTLLAALNCRFGKVWAADRAGHLPVMQQFQS